MDNMTEFLSGENVTHIPLNKAIPHIFRVFFPNKSNIRIENALSGKERIRLSTFSTIRLILLLKALLQSMGRPLTPTYQTHRGKGKEGEQARRTRNKRRHTVADPIIEFHLYIIHSYEQHPQQRDSKLKKIPASPP